LQVLRAFFLAERLPILTAGDQILCFHLVVACTRLFLWPVSSDQFSPVRACLGISGMKGNEGHWGGEISIIIQNFPKSHSILFHPLESFISQTNPT
jgi:hypothetical protein